MTDVSVVGGTGKLGRALATLWARAGLSVTIGSRDASRADEVASVIARETDGKVTGTANANAAKVGEIIVVTVPYASQSAILSEIKKGARDKIVVDTTVPLVPPKVMRVQLPEEGCAALRAQALLGDNVETVSAFHNVAAHKLATPDKVDCDVLVFGDKLAARERAVELANAAGLRGLHGGPLVNSASAEALTSVLIFMNKHYQVDGAGVRITGPALTGVGTGPTS